MRDEPPSETLFCGSDPARATAVFAAQPVTSGDQLDAAETRRRSVDAAAPDSTGDSGLGWMITGGQSTPAAGVPFPLADPVREPFVRVASKCQKFAAFLTQPA